MTISTVTNEQLKKLRDETIAAELMVSPTIVAVIDELLAVREAQSVPVKFALSTLDGHIQKNKESVFNSQQGAERVLSALSKALSTKINLKIVPLYTATPAPALPGEYIRDERGRMMLNGKFEPQIGFGRGWNACRAAILAAAPTPTKAVPDA